MNLKKLIKSRRGVAIELAIGVMFLLMAFTIMLLSTAGLQNRHRNDDYNSFKERIEINNVGEYVVEHKGDYSISATAYKIEGNVEENIPDGYYVLHSENNKFEIYRGDTTDGVDSMELVLTIEMNNGKITSWK